STYRDLASGKIKSSRFLRRAICRRLNVDMFIVVKFFEEDDMPMLVSDMHRTRKSFAKIKSVIDIRNLIDILHQSYDNFLQADVPENERKEIGLQAVFRSVFPIKDFNETASLEFVSYKLEQPKYDVDECHERGMTYAAPLKVVVRLVVWDTSENAAPQSI